jgi:mono/diheme cytochrome c family protein
MIRVIPSIVAAALLALPLAASAADAPTTQQLYDKHCKNCHGSDGKAQTKMGKKHEIDSFADAEWQAKHSDEKIRDVIANGKPKTKMKAYKSKLTAEQIDALVKHVRTFNPAK